jgi:hypothetical protein
MTGKRFFSLMAIGVAATGSGCVSCKHSAFSTSLMAYKDTGIPAPVRQRVYLFLLNGADLTDAAGLSRLRDKVCEAGFSKVYFAQRMDANWYEHEVRRVVLEEPSARVVLLGVGAAADKILPLAAGAIEEGVAVDSVILLDPVCAADLSAPAGCRTLAVRSRAWREPGIIRAEDVVVEKTGHLSVLNSPAVVEIVVGQMIASAGKVTALPGDPLPRTSLRDHPDPTPRPHVVVMPAAPDGAWNFLHSPPTLTPLEVPPVSGPPLIPGSVPDRQPAALVPTEPKK